MKRLLLITSIFALCLGLAVGAAPAQAEPETLVYSWVSNVGPLNPHLYSPNQMFAQAMIYEPLVRYGLDGKIKPCLAESWEISPDGRECIFHLRKDVAFTDGTPFNAEAAKKNLDAVMTNAKRHAWLEFMNQLQKTEIIDEYTIKITLKNPYYPFLQDLSLIRPIRFLSPLAFPDSGNTADGIKAAVGTGPWVRTEFKLGEYEVFERNEKYWGPKPAIRKILIKIIPDPNTRAVAFETGEIDLIYGDGQISLDTFDRFRNDPRYQTVISQPLATRSVAMNTARGATKELAVRRAIEHAVNKEAIISGVFLGTEIKADSLYSENIPYCDFPLPTYEYDPSKAEAILEEAGWKKGEGSAFRTRDGETLSVDFCFVGNDAVMKSVAEVIQSDLQQIGIQVKLLGEENDSFYVRQRDGEFDLIFNDAWGPPYEPHSYLSSWRVPSHADFKAQSGLPMKKEIDQLIGRVLVTIDEKERQELYRRILTTIHDQAVYLPISYKTGLIVHGEKVEGAAYGPTQYEIPFEDMSVK